MRAAITEAPAVRKRIEESTSSQWNWFGQQAVSGLKHLQDKDLVGWAQVWNENLAAKNVTSCAEHVRELTGEGGDRDVVRVLAEGVPARLAPQLSRILVRGAEARLTFVPLRRLPANADRKAAIEKFLSFIPAGEAGRFLKTMQDGPDRSSDENVCWLQLIWMKAIQATDDTNRTAVINMYLWEGYPSAWKKSADERKQAMEEKEFRERIRKLIPTY
jgi:hypothetical protein